MKKVWLLIILLIPVNCLALEIPNINSKYAIVYDLTSKEIIYEKDSDVKTSIASLTKILTVATALDKIDDLDRQVLITNDMLKDIYWNASVAGLKVGDIVTYQDLIYATILPSGADAAQVLAISLGGSVDNFIKEMND